MVEIKTTKGSVYLRRDAVLSLSINLNEAGKPIAAETIAIVVGGAAVLLHAPITDVAISLGFDRDDEPSPIAQAAQHIRKMIEDFTRANEAARAAVEAQVNGFTGIGGPVPPDRLQELQDAIDEADAWKRGKRDAA